MHINEPTSLKLLIMFINFCSNFFVCELKFVIHTLQAELMCQGISSSNQILCSASFKYLGNSSVSTLSLIGLKKLNKFQLCFLPSNMP